MIRTLRPRIKGIPTAKEVLHQEYALEKISLPPDIGVSSMARNCTFGVQSLPDSC